MAEYLLMAETERPSSEFFKLQPIDVYENTTFIIDLEHVKFGDWEKYHGDFHWNKVYIFKFGIFTS